MRVFIRSGYRRYLAVLLFLLILLPTAAAAANNHVQADELDSELPLRTRTPEHNAVVEGTIIDFGWDAFAFSVELDRKYYYHVQVKEYADSSIYKEIEGVGDFALQQGVSISDFPNDGSKYKWRMREGIWCEDRGLVKLGQWSSYFIFINGSLTVELHGDVNFDGVIDIRDAVLVMKHILAIETLDETQMKAADVNFDGKINVQDVALILQQVLE